MYYASLCVVCAGYVYVLMYYVSLCVVCVGYVFRVNVLRVSKCRLRVTCYVSLCVGYVIVCIVLEYTHAITLTWCVCLCVCMCVYVCVHSCKQSHPAPYLPRSYLVAIEIISILPDFKSKFDTHHLQDFNSLNLDLT
jgi:hypothetical protein